MPTKSSAHYQREYRRRLREQGLVKKEVWVRPEHAKQLLAQEKQLRIPGESARVTTETQRPHWTTTQLHQALLQTDLISLGRATVELIDGIEPTLHLLMTEYGDLPVFVTVAGEQVIVESLLWSIREVADIARFNDAILRTHKYFPLSTISLDRLGDSDDYYHMFGALSAASSLQEVVFEIDILASNVIQATEAYSEFLAPAAGAPPV